MGFDTILQPFLIANVFIIGVVVALAVSNAWAHFRPQNSREKKRVSTMLLPADTRARILNEAEEAYHRIVAKTAVQLEENLASTTKSLGEHLDRLGSTLVNDELKRYQTELDELRSRTQGAIGKAETEINRHQMDVKTKLLERQNEIDSKLAEDEQTLRAALVERQHQLETEFIERQNEYATRHAELEAKLTEHQTQLEAILKEREETLAEHQSRLDQEITDRQEQYQRRQADLDARLEQDMEKKRQFLTSQLDTKLSDSVTTFLVETLGQHVDLGAQATYLTTLLEEHKAELIKGVNDEL